MKCLSKYPYSKKTTIFCDKFLVMCMCYNYLSEDCSAKESIYRFFDGALMKLLNASIFRFIILNSAKKGILDFRVTAAADTCMKDVVESCPRNTLKENYGSISLTIIALNLANKGLSFYCSVIFTGLCAI